MANEVATAVPSQASWGSSHLNEVLQTMLVFVQSAHASPAVPQVVLLRLLTSQAESDTHSHRISRSQAVAALDRPRNASRHISLWFNGSTRVIGPLCAPARPLNEGQVGSVLGGSGLKGGPAWPRPIS